MKLNETQDVSAEIPNISTMFDFRGASSWTLFVFLPPSFALFAMNELPHWFASPESIVWLLWFSCSLLLSLERWPPQTNRNAVGTQHKQKQGGGSHPKSHIARVCLDVIFLSSSSPDRKVFLWTTFAFWTSPYFTPKPRLSEPYRFQATVTRVWQLPVSSCTHGVWALLAKLDAFLLREQASLRNKNSYFFKKSKLYATSPQNYANYLVKHIRLMVLKRLEIAKRFLPLGRQCHYNMAWSHAALPC